jgi:hypothetical protein
MAWTMFYQLTLLKVKVTFATAGQSVIKSWCQAPSGAHDQIYITVWQLQSCFCGAPSPTEGRLVCLLYMLLALASTVFLGSKFLGTCDCILLYQIWDFPFYRLLQLAGSHWRYSTTQSDSAPNLTFFITSWHRPHKNTALPLLECTCCITRNLLPINRNMFTELLPWNGPGILTHLMVVAY